MAKKISYYIVPADEYEALTGVNSAAVERESARIARDECFRLRRKVTERTEWNTSQAKTIIRLRQELAELQRQHDERAKWLKYWRELAQRYPVTKPTTPVSPPFTYWRR